MIPWLLVLLFWHCLRGGLVYQDGLVKPGSGRQMLTMYLQQYLLSTSRNLSDSL